MGNLYIITGSSHGLGNELVKLLTERGDDVIGLSRSAPVFNHEKFSHRKLDITDESAVIKLFQDLRRSCKLFCLINNAGIAMSRPALMTSSNAFEDTLKVNLVGAFTVTREALKIMKSQQFGRIINISSINVKLSSAGGIAYNASKSGLESLSHTISSELTPLENITTNNIGISLLSGKGMAENLTSKAIKDKIKFLKKPSLLNPEEVLHSIDFFTSEKAGNITGQTIYYGGLQ